MSLETEYRTHRAGALRAEHAGLRVTLSGWVHKRRDLGGVVFVDLRDRAGRVQLSFNPEWTPAATIAQAASVGGEYVIQVKGEVVLRPATARNPDMPTGEIEVHVSELTILNAAETPPILVAAAPGDELPSEDLRL